VENAIADPLCPFPVPPDATSNDTVNSLPPKLHSKSKIAMYCTGGIRCEKATALLKAMGYADNVYHLKGGVLRYLEVVPEQESLWEGECYVFDQRVSVTHGVRPGSHSQCRGCRMPLSAEDVSEEKFPGTFLEGVHCRCDYIQHVYLLRTSHLLFLFLTWLACMRRFCVGSLTDKKREAAAERQRQITLAAERAESHLGYCEPSKAEKKRKRELKRDRGRCGKRGEEEGGDCSASGGDKAVEATL
jgi:UPF0176 protein